MAENRGRFSVHINDAFRPSMNLKIKVCLTLVLSIIIVGASYLAWSHRVSDHQAWNAESFSNFKLTINIPEGPQNQPILSKSEIDPLFFVTLKNVTSSPIFLWKSSYGVCKDLYFEVTDENGHTTEVRQSLPLDITQDPGKRLRLDAGQATVVKIYNLSETTAGNFPWDNMEECPWIFPFPERGRSQKVTIRAILGPNLHWFPSQDLSWKGKAVSEPCEVILKNDAG
ncbi:MAG TPA: hypothetical protein VL981_00995 [Candidatus Methylacidiphilales bacterium]|nr:hypothetical protein [Candidatus Methylacidiphilales bacterium]